jgi:hypothetical protein
VCDITHYLRHRSVTVRTSKHDPPRPSLGGCQTARDQRAGDLHLAQAVRRIPGERREALEQLEAENARLKKLVAERDLEIEVMKEVAAKNW